MKTNASIAINQTTAAATQGAQVAPETTAAPKKATSRKAAPKASRGTKKAASKKAAKPAAKKASGITGAVPALFSKKNAVIDLLRRKDGATMAEIAKATDWQAHSIRGFISGQLTKRMGLKIDSSKSEAGERTYRIVGK